MELQPKERLWNCIVTHRSGSKVNNRTDRQRHFRGPSFLPALINLSVRPFYPLRITWKAHSLRRTVGGTQDTRLFDRHSNKVSSLLLHLVLQGLTYVLLIYSIYLVNYCLSDSASAIGTPLYPTILADWRSWTKPPSLAMFGFLFSWLYGKRKAKISCMKTQKL